MYIQLKRKNDYHTALFNSPVLYKSQHKIKNS